MRPLALVLQETRAGWWQLQGVCSGLLLLCVVASEVWDAETKPVEFVCHRGVRRSLNVAAATERALVSSANAAAAVARALTATSPPQRSCNGSMTLSAPVQMPCVELHAASWQNQTVGAPAGGRASEASGLSSVCVCASTRRRGGTSWRP